MSNIFDRFEDQPAEDWSLAEEAAQYAPPLWSPAHVEPEGITPLPEDFPVLDPFVSNPRIERFKSLMREHAVCKTKDCALDERKRLAKEVAEEVAESIGGLRRVAVVLWAHGETLLSEIVAEQVDHLVYDIIKPFAESAGIEIGDEADDE